jgi:UDP-glucose 4-epimerase
MTRVLVTGGAGFIGSHLVECLVDGGARVAVLDDFSSGNEENLRAVRDRIDLVRGDVRDGEALEQAFRGVEVIFHLAAIPSVTRSITDPVATSDVNLGGTLRVLESARSAGVRRVVFASSASVYGDAGMIPVCEATPTDPRSPYALQKLASEIYCRQYAELHGLETVALRFFNVFGPRQDPSSEYSGVIARFAEACRQGRAPVVYGDGKQTRDFVFVGDVVRASVRAAEVGGAAGAVLNVATGRPTTILDLLDAVRECTGTRVEPRFESAREGDIRFSRADVSRAQEVLGFEAEVDLGAGMRRIFANDGAPHARKGVEQ